MVQKACRVWLIRKSKVPSEEEADPLAIFSRSSSWNKQERQIKELQQKYFGTQGELYKTRQELIQPIQEKVFNAIETIANTRNYSFVFDKAGGMTLLYGDPKFDISDDVLDEVGTVMQTVKREQRGRN